MTERGLFVSFEGIDGCGKTTQIGLLTTRLREVGIEPILAQEPGGTRVGRLIRGVLLDSANADIEARSELLLYFASRVQNIAEVIRPGVEAGKVVVSDRFTDATLAYQGYGRRLGEDLVLRLSELACDGMKPDLTFWLDLEPETSLARARCRDDRKDVDESRMEAHSLEFFSRVRQGYAAIHAAEPGRVRRIDAGGTPDAVARRIFAVLLPMVEQLGLGPK